jgi:hypothetical protein
VSNRPSGAPGGRQSLAEQGATEIELVFIDNQLRGCVLAAPPSVAVARVETLPHAASLPSGDVRVSVLRTHTRGGMGAAPCRKVMNAGTPYNFWAYFPDGSIMGQRGWSMSSHGYADRRFLPLRS